MSPELAYLKGACSGDGGLYQDKGFWSIRLPSVDREFVEEFRRCVGLVKGGTVPGIRVCPPNTPSNPNGKKTKYTFECGWKRWPEIFAAGVTREFRGFWLRGLYDSEGGCCVVSPLSALDFIYEFRFTSTPRSARGTKTGGNSFWETVIGPT